MSVLVKEVIKQWRNWGGALGAIALPSTKKLNFLKEYENQSKLDADMDDTWLTCCRLSFSDFLLSAVPYYPASIYLLKIYNGNTKIRCKICSKLTIKTPERRRWHRSGVFIVNSEHISHLVLVFLVLILNM